MPSCTGAWSAWPGRWRRAASRPATAWRSCSRTCRRSRSASSPSSAPAPSPCRSTRRSRSPSWSSTSATAGCATIIAGPQSVETCAAIAARLPGTVEVIADGYDASRGVTRVAHRGRPPARPRRRPDDDAVYQYSSGSTGRPKRVPRTHRHLRAEADSYVAATGMTADDTLFCVIPLHHTYGLGCCLLAAVRSGARLVLFDDPNPFLLQRGRALELLERERATIFPAVPFTFRLLAEAPEGGRPLVAAALLLGRCRAAALHLRRLRGPLRRAGAPALRLHRGRGRDRQPRRRPGRHLRLGRPPARRVEIQIVDDDGPAARAGACGRDPSSGARR